MKTLKLKHFSIKGLFGYKNIEIPFNENIKILVGENGIGKTTILNILYYTLACKFEKLEDIDFETIRLEFYSGNYIEINKSELEMYFPSTNIEYLRNYLSDREWHDLLRHKEMGRIPHIFVERLARRTDLNEKQVYQEIKKFITSDSSRETNDYINNFKNIIESEFNCEIFYFPTYRRIEEDLHKLGIEEYNGKLIQFGMTDVERAFKRITQEIKDSAIQWFSKVNGEMLSQLISGINVTEEMINSIQRDALKIVLDRVGNNISDEYKERIDDLIKNDLLRNTTYEPLVYFLSNLIKIYQQQREKDEAIQQFAEICNKYLVGKKVEYDESSVEISIKQNGRKIDISKLSSGEKQIVSLFSRIFLDSNKEFIILFDEPELSLSIDWQSQLLPDILNSKRCSFMFVVTHSPFIFENDLDIYAKGLSSYISEEPYGLC
ncbi:AAA family ATPase [Brevibacillus sp. SYP-B805]|uniref:AAA family ATPase n=1 Tax=Brevibacillus sp. SYP-B805 TaxID=1578199 RepID=UPI0013EA78B3|nr:AAA family ATPase [Brevibacillus sp. SYP-B805]NGQ95525.1 AAA family ATPase [Brevibacillus sp. SYP-B805]